MNERKIAAASAASTAIGDAIGMINEQAFASLWTCDEADSLADLLRAFGRNVEADQLTAIHALSDTEVEDNHHDMYRRRNRCIGTADPATGRCVECGNALGDAAKISGTHRLNGNR